MNNSEFNEKQHKNEVRLLEARLKGIAAIIELGDVRLLASDGLCGGQPPILTLAEWKQMYRLATGEK
jgi:hypothetical protein